MGMLVTPYYDDPVAGITIYHGDAREIMPTLAGAADLLVTDPPYVGLTGGYSFGDQGGVARKLNESISVGDPWGASFDWVPDAMRSVRLGALVFCTYHSLPETALAFAAMRRAVLLTWHKRNAPATGRNVPRFTEEYIWGFAKLPGLQWDAYPTTMFDIPKLATGAFASPERFTDANGAALHPTQKPLDLMRRLMVIGGDVVIDPFMGSGTTLRAAKDLGRRAIGIEINEEYCEIAVERLRQEVLL